MSERALRCGFQLSQTVLSCLLLFGGILSLPRAAHAAPPAYKLFDLGDIAGGSGKSRGYGINSDGKVVGYGDFVYPDSSTSDGAFRSSGTVPLFTLTAIGDLGGFRSQGFGINASGQIVGESDDADFSTLAFRTTGGTLTSLGKLGGTDSTASGINATGQVSGTSKDAGNEARAFRSTDNSASVLLTDLGTLGGNFSQGLGINASGQVVGYSANSSGVTHAFRTSASGNVSDTSSGVSTANLGSLVGPTGSSFGQAINDSGQVTGFSDAGGGFSHAFLSSANGAGSLTLSDLGTLGGNSRGYGINGDGQVVGSSNGHAFLFSSGFGILDLNSITANLGGWTLTVARGINDSGFITGFGIMPGGLEHAFLLAQDDVQTTPEPGAVGLVAALGGAGVSLLRRRRRL